MKKRLLLVLGIAALAFLAGGLFSGVLSGQGADLWNIGYPTRADMARGQGGWLSSQFCGLPLAAKAQSGLFYPLQSQFFLLNLPAAFNTAFLLHVFLTGAGAALFAAELGLAFWPCLCAGLAFMLSGPVLWRISAGHLDVISTLAWTGFVFLGVLGLYRRPCVFNGALLALFGGLCVLAGHMQYAYMIALSSLFYALYLSFSGGWNRRFWVFASLAGAAAVAMSAVLWGPMLEVLKFSPRAGAGEVFFGSFSMPPENIVQILFPDIMGNYFRGTYFGRWYPWESAIYCGAGTFLLACAAVRLKARETLFFFIGFILAVCAAFGEYGPLLKPMGLLLPGFEYLRCPGRFGAVAVFFASILSAYGLQALMDMEDSARKVFLRRLCGWTALFAAIAGLVLLVAGRSGLAVWKDALRTYFDLKLRLLLPVYSDGLAQKLFAVSLHGWFAGCLWLAVFCGAALWLGGRKYALAAGLAIAVLCELLFNGARYVVSFRPDTIALDEGAATYLASQSRPFRVLSPDIRPAVFTASGFESADGYDSIRLADYQDYYNTAQGSSDKLYLARFSGLNQMTAYLNPKYLVTRRDIPSSPYLTLEYDGPGAKVYRWHSALERVFLACPVFATDKEKAFALLAASEPDRRPLAVLGENIAAAPLCGRGSVRITSYRPGRIEAEIMAEDKSFAVFSESHFPGWKAYVNGREANIYKANVFMQSVVVERGESKVVFVFKPVRLYICMAVSLAACLLVLLFFVCSPRLAASGKKMQ